MNSDLTFVKAYPVCMSTTDGEPDIEHAGTPFFVAASQVVRIVPNGPWSELKLVAWEVAFVPMRAEAVARALGAVVGG